MNREELIEKMLDAAGKIAGSQMADFTPSAQESIRKGMAAALDVAVGELLRDPTEEERGLAYRYRVYAESNRATTWGDREAAIEALIASRRSRYLKPKSAEDGVRELLAEHAGHAYGLLSPDLATKIVAAVRAADKSLA